MILFSHPTGNANARQAALGLSEAGLLGELWTALAWDETCGLGRCLPKGWRAQLARRAWPIAVRGRLRTAPWRELGRLLSGRAGLQTLIAHERGPFCVDAVFAQLDRRVARRLGDGTAWTGVYAYEDGAATSFRAAQEVGMARIYDLPIGYWRAGQVIYREEAERVPEWAATLTGIRDSAEKLARKDQELALADLVVVASTFTKKTLAGAPAVAKPVVVIPYGAPEPVGIKPAQSLAPQKLRVLFAGSLTQRKGLSYLIEAVRSLGPRIELTLLGAMTGHDCHPVEEAVRRFRWLPSLPHAEVLAEMARHDVLVFPSLFEGFGLVILEAMAQGTPVITTPHTAGPDLIEDGIDGYLVPIRDAAAIAARLEGLLRDRALLDAMSDAARRKAATFSWRTYRQCLAATVSAELERARS